MDERSERRLPSDELVRKQIEQKRRKELAAYKADAGKIVGLARGPWDFAQASYDEASRSVFLGRGDMKIRLWMEPTDGGRRQFEFSQPASQGGFEPKDWESLSGLEKGLGMLGLKKVPMNVKELTEIRVLSMIKEGEKKNEVRQVLAFDSNDPLYQPEVLLALVFSEEEGKLKPESWKLVRRAQLKSPLAEDRIVAEVKPKTNWYIDSEV